MKNIEELEQEIIKINNRNQKVEQDKAWELSWFRRLLIIIFTYIAMGIYLGIINIEKPWLNAIVPAIAFMLSTLTLPIFKQFWLKYFIKK
ncbi:MAG: hypothetical protein PHV78_03990 [Patescibacteria group bacterium]|nr:hypothetical protein [Patescibacteria group bacterium]MDD5121454.1 hypothetical protein [Patescibacteria group bacterium]MDD5222034.1 hypothetical protein [Patescibacteria group bacterium]MDD5396384.1 hypothetical protein [Patescibacteria group bacterium]